MRRTTRSIWMVTLGCVLLSGCRDSKKAEETEKNSGTQKASQPADQVKITTQAQSEQKITLAPVEAGQSLASYQAKGRIALPDNATWHVGVLAEGRVERVYFNLGDSVARGQVLARMHSHDVHEARAAYANAMAERTRAQAAESLAQRNYERSQRLYALKAESVVQTEDAKQQVVNAQAATREADNNVHREQAHLSEILGVVPSSNMSDDSQDLMPIKAPASGRILQKNVTPGAVISPSTDAFVIGDLSHLWMLASVDAAALAKLKVGQRATVTVPDVLGATYQGVISNLGQEFDPTTRMIQVRITVSHPDNRLRPEMLANAEFGTADGKPTLFVPQEAVQQVNGEDVVFVQTAPDIFHVQTVQLGESTQGKVRVLKGLTAGQRVINQGSFIAKSELLKSSIGD
ncbi:MAG: efflux RND transporter periplasmic adaptor subunit [Acidobacteriaceae bacterium]